MDECKRNSQIDVFCTKQMTFVFVSNLVKGPLCVRLCTNIILVLGSVLKVHNQFVCRILAVILHGNTSEFSSYCKTFELFLFISNYPGKSYRHVV